MALLTYRLFVLKSTYTLNAGSVFTTILVYTSDVYYGQKDTLKMDVEYGM